MSEVRSLPSLQSQIATVSFLSSFSPTSSNETLTPRNKLQPIYCVTASNRHTESRMSEVRSLSSLQSQIPTVSFLSSFSPTSSNETLTPRNRGQPIYCVTASTWHEGKSPHGEPDVRGEISVFTPESDSHCIFPLVILSNIEKRNVDAKKQTPTNLLRHCQHIWDEGKSPHGESDVRGEISVFTPESDSHCIFPLVILPSIK